MSFLGKQLNKLELGALSPDKFDVYELTLVVSIIWRMLLVDRWTDQP